MPSPAYGGQQSVYGKPAKASPIPAPPATGAYKVTAPKPMTAGERARGKNSYSRPTQTTYYVDGQKVTLQDYDFELAKPRVALAQQADISKLTGSTYANPEALRLFLQSQESESATAASYLRRQALFNALL